jgi:glycosyltransferase involved in cell wall biosynthesis
MTEQHPGDDGHSTDPAVSIIVPCYNTAGFVAEALESAFAQTFRDFEVVVVNDGSPDTPALERALAPYLDRITYVRQENRGLSGARNTAIRHARGRFVALLDSDDVLEPDYLAVQVAAIDGDPPLDVVYCDARLFGDHPHAGRRYMDVCPSDGEVTFENLVTQRCQVFISVLARRAALERAGLFDPALRSSEDFDMWVRVLLAGGRIGYHRRVLVRFRKHQASLSADPIWMGRSALKAYDKAMGLEVTADQRRLLEARRADIQARLDLDLAKQALLQGEHDRAREHLAAASAHLHSSKLMLAALGLRLAPNLVRRAYAWRGRPRRPERALRPEIV